MRTPPLAWFSGAAGFLGIALTTACVTVGVNTPTGSYPRSDQRLHVHIDPCIDRTETAGRDVGADATQAFEQKLGAAAEFAVVTNARYRLACEISSFVEGSALKRWVQPGWGATVGQVSAMLTDAKTGDVLVIARGNATVASGGLFTIGADNYIVASAVENVVEQLRSWARRESPDDRRGTLNK